MLFFTERKASKELQASGLTVRAAGSGSVAAMKDGVHARGARVIRQSPPIRRYHTGWRSHGARLAPAGADFPAAITSRTANVGLPSEARANNCREPWVYASQQKIESPRRESR